MRHVGFLVVGSELALDGEQKDLEIPLFLKPERETEVNTRFLFGQCPPVYGTPKALCTLLEKSTKVEDDRKVCR